MRKNILILKGNIIYTKTPEDFTVCEHSYLVCRDGSVDGIYRTLPFRLGGNPIRDFGDCLIIPGLTDLQTYGSACPRTPVSAPRVRDGSGTSGLAGREYISGGSPV